MINWLKNWWQGRYWLLEYNDAYALDVYLLPERYYSRASAERAARRSAKKGWLSLPEKAFDWVNVVGPFEDQK